MADYHPLIVRAVGGLEQNTAEVRRALYERARTALVAQLRGVDPPLDEADITRERVALEEAIRKVEAEFAAAAEANEAATAAQPHEDEKPASFPPVAAPEDLVSLTDKGLKGFRDTVAEAETLGNAAAKASRSAREFYDRAPATAPGIRSASDRPAAGHADEVPATPGLEPAHPHHPPEPRADHAETERVDWPPPPTEPDAGFERAPRSYRGLMTIVIVLTLLGAIGATAFWQRARIVSLASSLMKSSPPVSQPQQPARDAAQGRPKIADRIGADNRAADNKSATSPTAAVAQKVVLYEEDPNNPQGKRYVGSALWKTETVSPGPGLAPELVVRADVDIPERRMRMTWSLRRNTDKALPASHTIEVMFTLPADFAEGAVNNIPGVLMKQNEETRGVPLAGLAVKVTNGFFLVGLSASEVDLQRNIQLLKERSWFDVPVVYTSGKRAILAVEKGTPGERAFEEAFRAWSQ